MQECAVRAENVDTQLIRESPGSSLAHERRAMDHLVNESSIEQSVYGEDRVAKGRLGMLTRKRGNEGGDRLHGYRARQVIQGESAGGSPQDATVHSNEPARIQRFAGRLEISVEINRPS